MKLSYPEQLKLSVELAALVGWKRLAKIGDSMVGYPPRKAGRMLVPNYFDREAAAGKSELIEWVCNQSLATKTHFLHLLDAHRTGGALFAAINRDDPLTVEDALTLLNAPPGVVAGALVEVFALNEAEQSAVAA